MGDLRLEQAQSLTHRWNESLLILPFSVLVFPVRGNRSLSSCDGPVADFREQWRVRQSRSMFASEKRGSVDEPRLQLFVLSSLNTRAIASSFLEVKSGSHAQRESGG